jgi:hypothetical protein
VRSSGRSLGAMQAMGELDGGRATVASVGTLGGISTLGGQTDWHVLNVASSLTAIRTVAGPWFSSG